MTPAGRVTYDASSKMIAGFMRILALVAPAAAFHASLTTPPHGLRGMIRG